MLVECQVDLHQVLFYDGLNKRMPAVCLTCVSEDCKIRQGKVATWIEQSSGHV